MLKNNNSVRVIFIIFIIFIICILNNLLKNINFNKNQNKNQNNLINSPEGFQDSSPTCSNICGLFNGKMIPCPPPPCGKKVEINDVVYNKVNEVLKNKASKIKKNIPFKVGDLKITISDDKSISYIDDSCICNKK